MKDADIIEALGNTALVAEQLGVDMRVISNWKKRGIPLSGKGRVYALARKRRLKLPEDFLTRPPVARNPVDNARSGAAA